MPPRAGTLLSHPTPGPGVSPKAACTQKQSESWPAAGSQGVRSHRWEHLPHVLGTLRHVNSPHHELPGSRRTLHHSRRHPDTKKKMKRGLSQQRAGGATVTEGKRQRTESAVSSSLGNAVRGNGNKSSLTKKRAKGSLEGGLNGEAGDHLHTGRV